MLSRAIASDMENWMSLLNDDRLITDVAIPGSHNSCSYSSDYSFSRCQSTDLPTQLRLGVRYLDLRFTLKNDELKMYHGWDDLKISFDTCLRQVKSYLEEHPSEIILLRLQKERKYVPGLCDIYYQAIVSSFKKIGLPLVDTSDLTNFRVGDLRGKAIVVEYNNIPLYNEHRTYPHITGYSYWGYLSNRKQVEAKWQDILKEEVPETDKHKFKRINLYSSGGRKILGITIPNPKSFTKLFVEEKFPEILELIHNKENNKYIYIVDFEELYSGSIGKFYQTIIQSNFEN